MAKKRVRLAKNFYYSNSGSIQFRKMVRGELITGRTGLYDPHKVNKLALDLSNRFINEHFQLVKKKPKKKKVQLKKLKKQFLKSKSHLSANTIRTYKSNLNVYMNGGLPNNKSKSYVNGVRRDWNIFSRWCKKMGYDIPVLKGDVKSEGRMRVVTEDEMNSIITVIESQDLKDCLLFIYYTGARRKEANKPKREWLRKNNRGGYYLQVIKKGGYKRIIRVNNQAMDIIKQRNYEFWSFDVQWLTRGFKRYARKAGVRDVHLHDLRRTFGYNCLVKEKMDISIVARLLGISLKVCMEHYTPILTSDIEDFVL